MLTGLLVLQSVFTGATLSPYLPLALFLDFCMVVIIIAYLGTRTKGPYDG